MLELHWTHMHDHWSDVRRIFLEASERDGGAS